MHLDLSPIEIVGRRRAEHVVGLGWFVAKDVRPDDRVTFSDDRGGRLRHAAHPGRVRAHQRDRENVEAAIADQARGASALGEQVPGRGPTLVPPGSSLHYQGTTRMGEADDGKSVCDSMVARLGLRQPLRRRERRDPDADSEQSDAHQRRARDPGRGGGRVRADLLVVGSGPVGCDVRAHRLGAAAGRRAS